MQRLFEKPTTLFKPDMPTNILTINILIKDIEDREKKDEISEAIIALLKATKKFLNASDPTFQEERNSINEKAILKILNEAGDALVKFKPMMTENSEASDAFHYSIRVFEARLKELKNNKDKIYASYSAKDNTLKTQLTQIKTEKQEKKTV